MSNLVQSLGDTAIVLAGALAVAVLVYWVSAIATEYLSHRNTSKGIENFRRPAEIAPEAKMGSAAWKIRSSFAAYGFDVAGKEETAFYTAWAVIGLLVALVMLFFQMSLLIALIAGVAVGYFGVQAIIAGRWEKTRLEIDSEVPTFLRNLSGIVQAEPNVLQALDSARESLDPAKPLNAWITYLIQSVQAHGAGAFNLLLDEAGEISSALVVTVFEIQRLYEAGGQGYIRALRMTADNLAEILTVKALAASKAAGATGLAKTIIGAAVFSLGYILMSDMGKDLYLNNPLVPIGIAAAVAWGVYGWIFIKDMVREATE